jgi:hypothetical protein
VAVSAEVVVVVAEKSISVVDAEGTRGTTKEEGIDKLSSSADALTLAEVVMTAPARESSPSSEYKPSSKPFK